MDHHGCLKAVNLSPRYRPLPFTRLSSTHSPTHLLHHIQATGLFKPPQTQNVTISTDPQSRNGSLNYQDGAGRKYFFAREGEEHGGR